MSKLITVLDVLLAGTPLPATSNDHPPKGDWKGFRDLHVEPDWLLLNQIEDDELRLARTGRHADLFDD